MAREYRDQMESTVEHVLSNGLRIVVLPFRDWPVAATLACYRAGSLHEPDGCAGIAHLMEHMMFRGTEKFPGGAIDAMTARLGGVNNAVTTTDYAAYYFALPRDGWITALEIEADRIQNCRIDHDVLEIERRVALEERRMASDDPESMVDEALDAAMFGDHAYGRPVMGLMRDIAGLSAKDMTSFYASRYVPANVSIVVVGGVSVDDAFAATERLFGDLPETAVAGADPVELDRPAPRRECITTDRSTPRIAMGFPTPDALDPDSPALELLVTLLASGRSSRLYDRLVRRDRVATEVSCSRLLQREPGSFTMSATLHPGASPARAERAMIEEITSIAGSVLSDDEFRKARRLARADLAAAHDTALGAAATLALWEAVDTWRAGVAFEKRMRELGPEDLTRVAMRFLDRERMSCVWLRPADDGGDPAGEARS